MRSPWFFKSAVVKRADVHGAPVGSSHRLRIEGEVEAVQRDVLGCRCCVGIALPADAAEDRSGEGRRLGFDGELLQIEAHFGGDFLRHAWIGDHLRKIRLRTTS